MVLSEEAAVSSDNSLERRARLLFGPWGLPCSVQLPTARRGDERTTIREKGATCKKYN